MNTLINTQNQTNSSVQRLKHSQVSNRHTSQTRSIKALEDTRLQSPATLLHGVLESLMDGILILTEQGTLIEANSYAMQLCRQFIQDLPSSNDVPQQIWHVCEALIESRELFPNHEITIEDEVIEGQTNTVRIRARWIELDNPNRPYLLVTLEDRHQSLKNVAIAEARKYGLTSREAEVWILRRANRTYKAIAAELHIAIDTVKKHVKSIHAKRDAFLWANESP